MWHALVVCSSCAEEIEVVVDDLDELDRRVCACEHGCVVASVAEFRPVYGRRGEVVELRRREQLGLAA